MERKIRNVALSSLFAAGLIASGPSIAQSTTTPSSQGESTTTAQSSQSSDSASAGQSSPSRFEERANNDSNDKDWGWLGLLGLIGLAGLRRRHDRDVHRDTTSRVGAYNK